MNFKSGDRVRVVAPGLPTHDKIGIIQRSSLLGRWLVFFDDGGASWYAAYHLSRNPFKAGDRVRSTQLPPDVTEHEIGTVGTVTETDEDYDGQLACYVKFDDGDGWYCLVDGLEYDLPCTIEEALAGITEILTTDIFHKE